MATTPMLLHHELPSGARVRLRHPLRADTASLRALVGDGEAEQLLRFDPRRRTVLCAVDFEEVVGVGAIEHERGASPDVLAVGPDHGEDLAELLDDVLRGRAQPPRRTTGRRRALPMRALRGIARRP